MNTFKKLLGAAASIALCTSYALAEVNPTEATQTESVGESNLEVNIPVLARISGIADLTATTTDVADVALDPDETTGLRKEDGVCIYTNHASNRDYSIKMWGTSTCTGCTNDVGGNAWANNKFQIVNDALNMVIPYQPFFTTAATVNFTSSLWDEAGTEETNLTGGTASYAEDCGAADNASFGFEIDAPDLLAAKAGQYIGVLHITLVPPV